MKTSQEQMDTSIVNTEPLEIFSGLLEKSIKRHKKKYEGEINAFIGETEKLFAKTLNEALSELTRIPEFAPYLKGLSEITFKYLDKMRWVAWGNCELGPPLGLAVSEDFVLAILVYLSARLIDDGIDGHETYKGKVKSTYAYLKDKTNEQIAAGLTTLLGNYLFNYAIIQLKKRSYPETAHWLLSTYAKVITGALAETMAKETTSESVYGSIVNHKSVDYDLILHQVFVRSMAPSIQKPILEFLKAFSLTAQWANDLLDDEDDKKRKQLNILRVEGMSHYRLYNKIANSLHMLWEQTGGVPQQVRDALAIRLNDLVKLLIETAKTD